MYRKAISVPYLQPQNIYTKFELQFSDSSISVLLSHSSRSVTLSGTSGGLFSCLVMGFLLSVTLWGTSSGLLVGSVTLSSSGLLVGSVTLSGTSGGLFSCLVLGFLLSMTLLLPLLVVGFLLGIILGGGIRSFISAPMGLGLSAAVVQDAAAENGQN